MNLFRYLIYQFYSEGTSTCTYVRIHASYIYILFTFFSEMNEIHFDSPEYILKFLTICHTIMSAAIIYIGTLEFACKTTGGKILTSLGWN